MKLERFIQLKKQLREGGEQPKNSQELVINFQNEVDNAYTFIEQKLAEAGNPTINGVESKEWLLHIRSQFDGFKHSSTIEELLNNTSENTSELEKEIAMAQTNVDGFKKTCEDSIETFK